MQLCIICCVKFVFRIPHSLGYTKQPEDGLKQAETCSCVYIVHMIIIGIQPLGRSGQRPEFSQATGMALHPGQVLRGSLPLLSPAFQLFPLFTTRCLNVRHDVRDPSGGSGNCGRECCPVILPKCRLPRHLGIFYMPQIYDMGPTALLPFRRKAS